LIHRNFSEWTVSIALGEPIGESILIPKGHVSVVLPAKKIKCRQPLEMAPSAIQDLVFDMFKKLVRYNVRRLQWFQFLSGKFNRAYSI